MSSATQSHPYYEQDRGSKEGSSEISSPQDNNNYAAAPANASTAAPVKRGVRHLTAAQLAKKRANDRDSQRAIRERTKKQIETLEARVKDLESGAAYQELDAIIKEKEALQVENAEIRARLVSVMAMLQPILDAQNGQLSAPSNAFEGSSRQPQSEHGSSAHITESSAHRERDTKPGSSVLDYTPADASHFDQHTPTSLHAQSPAPNVYPSPSRWTHAEPAQSQAAYQYGGVDSFDRPTENGSARPPSHILRPLRRGQPSHDHTTSVPNSPLPWPLPTTPQERPYTAMGTHHEEHANTFRTPTEPPPMHTQRPNNIRPTCHFDSIIFDFTTEARKRISAGEPVEAVLGPPEPDLTTFMYPNMQSGGSIITALLVGCLRTYSAITGLPERIMVFMNMYTHLRWYISTTLENYNLIPEHMRPVESQVRVPHPIWVDMLPWPAMRAKLVSCYPSLPLDKFFIPYTTTMSVNWPANGDARSCLYQPEGTSIMQMTPALRTHWRNIDNYSLSRDFGRQLPELADTCRYLDDDERNARR